MLTKKDFEVISEIISNEPTKSGMLRKDRLIESLCDYFKENNKLFIYEAFVRRCYGR